VALSMADVVDTASSSGFTSLSKAIAASGGIGARTDANLFAHPQRQESLLNGFLKSTFVNIVWNENEIV
jgi:hypothetical protein